MRKTFLNAAKMKMMLVLNCGYTGQMMWYLFKSAILKKQKLKY
jgi:hypothetical protein